MNRRVNCGFPQGLNSVREKRVASPRDSRICSTHPLLPCRAFISRRYAAGVLVVLAPPLASENVTTLLQGVNLEAKGAQGFAHNFFFTDRNDGGAVGGEIFFSDRVDVSGRRSRHFLPGNADLIGL